MAVASAGPAVPPPGAPPVLRRLAGSPLYLADPGNPAAARCAFLATSAPSALPPTLTAADALTSQPGVFLFVPALPYDALDPQVTGRFVEAVLAFLAAPAQGLTRFVWIADPAGAAHGPAGLATMTLAATSRGSLVTVPWAGYVSLAPNVVLRVAGGTVITVSPDGTGLVLTGSPGPNALLVTPRGQSPATEVALTSDVALSLLGPAATAGCLSLAAAPDEPALDALGVGLRYFVTDLSFGPPPDGAPAFVDALRYPVFALKGTRLPLTAVVDPLAPLDQARSSFSFGTASAPVGAPIATYFRSSLNAPITLLPRAGARLVFAVDVRAETTDGRPDPTDPYYLTPAGDFSLAIDDSAGRSGDFADHLMAGTSTQEYFAVPGGTTGMTFKPGNPAFAPARPAPPGPSAALYGPLTAQASTSWVYLTGQETYYAQPDSAVVHQPNPDPAHPGFLTYLPLEAGTLPALTADPAQAFPVAPYAGVVADAADYAGVEAQVLSPARRAAVYRLTSAATTTRGAGTAAPGLAAGGTAGGAAHGTTPQGLLLDVEAGDWRRLTLAQTPAGPDAGDEPMLLQFSDVTGPLRGALQSGHLFMVASSCRRLLGCAGIPTYMLTVQSFTDLEQSNAPVVPAEVLGRLRPLQQQRYGSLPEYRAALQQALGPDYPTYADLLVQVGASADVSIDSWHFDLSPYFWAGHGTMMLFKFTDVPLASLIDDTASWAMAEELNDDALATQQALRAYCRAAADDKDPHLAYFRETVLKDPSWNGILFLNARVPLSSLPPQIEGIAAGVDPDRFMAHHVGVSVTPVEAGTTLSPHNSTLFGLIRYSDPGDLDDTTADYQFKVQQLNVLFANSEVTSFASTIELMANQFFGEPVQLVVEPENGGPGGPGGLVPSPAGNNLKLRGVYQKHGGRGSYVFTNQDTNHFRCASRVLDHIIVESAEFVTIVPPSGAARSGTVQTRFTLAGSIGFKALPGFDAFSYGAPGGAGGLAYRGLSVDMSFAPDTPTQKTFAFDARQVGFDPSSSATRPDSLHPHFPLRLAGLVQATGTQTPGSLGYMPVGSPLTGSPLSGAWYGLVFDLDLGTLGALAPPGGFVASLLLGWQPDPARYRVHVGLRIPGATGGKREISLQGVLKLTFGDLRFVVTGPGAYVLQLRGIALNLLSISFPPGQTDLLLFGDPSGQDNSTLGWYAAYAAPGGSGTGGTGGGQPVAASPPTLVDPEPRRRRGDLR
ncbi:hypothetical protein [Streptomyces sp. DSM 15324]|uniref:hypothetical protein n=1 Tax=Streptomyces sp. DSM 15324 TaxID=1739111 RepID=UPI000748C1DC|nr:hypothetical protein [Streptomyces sp. DSM 15324]KUO09303.1 hypothetical protein AQJ58_25185 [Streptomyces sp. DSM 15324]